MTDRADVIISSLSPTKEFAKRVDFSVPYAIFRMGLLVNSKSHIKSIKDVKKR